MAAADNFKEMKSKEKKYGRQKLADDSQLINVPLDWTDPTCDY